ncbi:unnamed protein product [Tilletia caries]|nr:unnamed protein product [Tilletia caries]
MALKDITNRVSDDEEGPARKRRRSERLSQDVDRAGGAKQATGAPTSMNTVSSESAPPALNADAPFAEQVQALIDLVRVFRGDPKFQPREEQLEAALRTYHGWDGIYGAATGSGKSLIWELLALLYPQHTIMVICPLIALEADQVGKYRDTKIRAVSLSQVTSESLYTVKNAESEVGHNRIKELRRQHLRKMIISEHAHLVFASPEAVLDNPSVQDLLKDPIFKGRLRALVVDEAHVVQTWGLTPSARSALPFRPAFSRIQTLRTRLGAHLPLLAVSATLPAATAVPKTLIYVRTRAAAYEAAAALQHHFDSFGPAFDGIVRPFTALSSSEFKLDTISNAFQPGGHVRVLIATEAGGLGIDLPDIDHVVQFEIPNDVLDLAQHFGRTMRVKSKPGRSSLLAQRWSVVDSGNETMTISAHAERQRSALSASLRRITDLNVCVRQTIISETRLNLRTVEEVLFSLRCVKGGLWTIPDHIAECSDNPSNEFLLAASTHKPPTSVTAEFCCTSRPCSGSLAAAAFSSSTASATLGTALTTAASSSSSRSVVSAPPAHPKFLVVQQSLKAALILWRSTTHKSRQLPSLLPSRALLPDLVAERILALTTRFLASRGREEELTTELLVEDLGPLVSLIYPGIIDSLALAVDQWCKSYSASNTEVMHHISSRGAFLSHPAPRPSRPT